MEKRVKALLDLLKPEQDVLSVGCAANPELHRLAAGRCRSLTGVDIDPAGVASLAGAGFDARVMNAEDLHLDRKFDVVLAGELIEHLDNPGKFFDGAARCLKPGGLLILTTPNIASVFLRFLIFTCDQTQDASHVCYYDMKSLLALIRRRNDFEIELTDYAPPTPKALGSWFVKPIFYLATIAANAGFLFSKRLFGSYIILTCRLRFTQSSV